MKAQKQKGFFYVVDYLLKTTLEKLEIICSLNTVNMALFSNEKILCIARS
jgi:hypothetical protein